MPGEGETEKHRFFTRSVAYIVDDEWDSFVGFLVTDDHDVREIRRNRAGDNIAWQEIRRDIFRSASDLVALAFEPSLQIRDASMVNIPVGPGEAPVLRVAEEIFGHVLMDDFLEIPGQAVPHGADEHIRTHTSLGGDIAARVGKSGVARIIDHRDADLLAGGTDELFPGLRMKRQDEDRAKGEKEFHGKNDTWPAV